MADLARFQSASINRSQIRTGNSNVMVDKELKDIIARMNKSVKNLQSSSKLLKKVLGLPQNRMKSLFARALRKVVPNALHEYIPEGVAIFISEELDLLDFTEGRLRGNTNEAQMTAGDMALMAISQRDQLDQSRDDLTQAIEEDWDAKRLRAYLSEKVGIEIDPNIEKLLDDRYDYLPLEERQRRKDNLLKRLDIGLNNRRELCESVAKACAVQLDTLDEINLQLYEFVAIKRPLAVLRDAGITMTENARAILATSAVVQDTFERSIQEFEAIIEIVPMFDKHALSSADMNQRFVNGRKRLEIGLAKIEQGRVKTKLLTVGNKAVGTAQKETEAQ